MPIRGSPNGLRHFIHTVLSPWRLAVTLGWNGWSSSIGNSGHLQSEPVVTMPRCAHAVAEFYDRRKLWPPESLERWRVATGG
jgi:hypothetical protein